MVNASEAVIWSVDVDVDESRLDAELERGLPMQSLKLTRGKMQRLGLYRIAQIQTEYGIQVFADAKIGGVPHEVVDAALPYLDYHPWMLNVLAGETISNAVMSGSGSDELDGLKRFADLCRTNGTLSCAVTVLTSKDKRVVNVEYNGRTATEQVLVYADWLVQAGFTDIVCSPLEAAALRSDGRFRSLTINTPGVRLTGDSLNDQSRVDTPAGAIANGADRLVIGSSLSKGDLHENFKKIEYDLTKGN